jgi:hypothetical protein
MYGHTIHFGHATIARLSAHTMFSSHTKKRYSPPEVPGNHCLRGSRKATVLITVIVSDGVNWNELDEDHIELRGSDMNVIELLSKL